MPKHSRMIPREHGAWMMLYAPLVIGASQGTPFRSELILDFVGLVLLATGGYAIRVPLSALLSSRTGEHPIARRWLLRYSEIALVGALLLARNPNRVPLLAFVSFGGVLFAVHFTFTRRRAHRGLFGELLGVAGLTMTGPLAYLTALGDDFVHVFVLWALNFLFFGSSVFYVKWRVRKMIEARRGTATTRERHLLALYHIMAAIALVGLAILGLVPWGVLVAFLPLGARVFLGRITRGTPSLVQIGVSEIVLSLSFVALSIWAL